MQNIRSARRALVALSIITGASVLGVALGCTGSGAPPKPPGGIAGACTANTLPACVQAIDDALAAHEDPTSAVREYAAARAKSGDAGLQDLLEAMDASTVKAFGVGIGGAQVAGKSLSALTLASSLADAPDASARLLLAIGKASGATFVVGKLPDGTMLRAYPTDALAPLAAGYPAIVIDKQIDDIDAEVALEAELARGAAAGAAFDYVTLADAIDVIDAYARTHPGYGAASLRARIFSAFVGLSELRLSESAAAAPPPRAPGPPPPPTELETPYYDLLRMRLDADQIEWPARGARVLAATPEARRPAMTAVFADAPPCGLDLPPTIERIEDLVFSGLVGRALLPTLARDPQGRVPLATWYPAYAEFVKTVSATETTYLFASRLVAERGGSAGIIPNGSEAHRIVTNLAIKHARALEKLATARPGRVGLAQVPFLIAPGNMVDADLRKATLDLAQTIARSGLAEAETAGDTLLALLTGVLTGFDLGGDLRAAHLGALQSVFTAKLKGDLATKTGWGVALLYGIDGAYRLAFDQSPNLGSTAAEITRALEGDPTIEQPAAAHLVGAVARYVTLAVRGELGPAQPKSGSLRPERATAKAALEKALSELGASPAAGEKADDTFVRDVAELSDASLATVASTVAERLQTTPTASAEAGCPNDVTPLDPRTKNALPPLRDLRNKVMAHPAWKAPSSPRARRLKLVVLAISDVLDAIEDNGKHERAFAISPADAQSILRAALDEWISDEGLVNAISGAYGLVRGYVENGNKHFGGAGTIDIRTLLGGLGTFLKGDGIEGALLLSRLLPSRDAGKSEDFLTALVKVARTLYAEKKPDEADMLLLGAFVVSAVNRTRISPEAEELARAESTSISSVLGLTRAVADLRRGDGTDTASFAKEMNASPGARCAVSSVSEVSTVLTAVQSFREGKRAEARAALRGVLSALEHKGFALPRYRFVFKQETRSRALSLSVEIGLAQGLVDSPNAFSVGVGAKTDGEPVLRMDKSVSPSDTGDGVDEAAKYYVHALAILAMYDYLDGDLAEGDLGAARVVSALRAPSWLSRGGLGAGPSAWVRDSASALLVLGELAAANDRPFLAGDLLTLVKQSLRSDDDAESLGSLLDPVPFGLAGVKDAEPVVASAKKTLDLLAAHLPCMKGKKPAESAPGCGEWSRAIALRVADVLPALPKLTPKKGAGNECPDAATIDGFLQAADKRVYDPDKFLSAVDVLVAAKKPYEASVMLTRFRRDDHCSESVNQRLTALIAALAPVPALRADLESVVVNCSTGAAPAELGIAIAALDEDLARVGDPGRSTDLVLFAAGVSLRLGTWEPLQAIALKPKFVERWEASAPGSLYAGLLFDHVATILHGDPVRIDATAPQYGLVCGATPAAERAQLCKTLEGLRKAGKPDDALKKAAIDAITSLTSAP